jgi:subtilisin family serine protease
MRNTVAGRYLVVMRDGTVAGNDIDAVAAELLHGDAGAAVRHVYKHALIGFAADMSEQRAQVIALDPRVELVQQDSYLDNAVVDEPMPIINGPPWNLDRIDEHPLVDLDGTYLYKTTGLDVNVYVIDSGIRATHVQFEGRVVSAFSAIADGHGTDDGHPDGHGTHVAGIVGARDHGVAKQARLHAVRVYGWGAPQPTTADVVAGINWVAANHHRPAVANLSTSDWANPALDKAVRNLVTKHDVTCVVAAGNDEDDASMHSPARVRAALTVSATNKLDERGLLANYGPAVDVFAPGSEIMSTGNADDEHVYPNGGTSMAAPHVAGVVARYLQRHAQASYGDVSEYVIGRSTRNELVLDPAEQSANRLLYMSPLE